MADGGSLLGLSQRLPPSNLQAEQALLGALLANNKALERVADFLEPRHFADPVNGVIYRRVTERILGGQLADAVTLRADLENSGLLDEVGGLPYLAQLLSSMISVNHASEYGRVVLDCWVRRQLIALGEEVVNNAFGYDPALGGIAQVAHAENLLSSLRVGDRRADRMSTAGELVSGAIKQAEGVHKGTPSGRVLTGMATIDRAVRLLPQTLTLLAGPPGAGKTALAVQLAKSMAKELHAERDDPRQPGVAIYSLEMSGEELGLRMAAHEAEIGLDRLLDGKLDLMTASNLARAERDLARVPLRIWDCTSTSLRLLPRKIRMHLSRQPELLIVIDHLLAGSADDGDKDRRGFGNEAAGVQALANSLKQLARETGLPFLVLTHTPRPPKGVEVKRPTLFDVKYAGEGVADNVMFVHRPIMFMDRTAPTQRANEGDTAFKGPNGRLERWRYALERAEHLAEIVVAKQRMGTTGVYPMRFAGATTSFAEMGESHGEQNDYEADGDSGDLAAFGG